MIDPLAVFFFFVNLLAGAIIGVLIDRLHRAPRRPPAGLTAEAEAFVTRHLAPPTKIPRRFIGGPFDRRVMEVDRRTSKFVVPYPPATYVIPIFTGTMWEERPFVLEDSPEGLASAERERRFGAEVIDR